MNFTIAKPVLDLKIKVAIIVIKNMTNSLSNKEFIKYREQTIKDIQKELTMETIENNNILKGFWKLHEKIGKTSKHDVSSPENLLNMLLKNNTFPNINLIVDIYNLVSIKTKLALGAHDLDYINGNVTLRLTNGNEKFLPIGYSKPKPISRGEYAYIDDDNDVLCRMEVRQVEKTKVTLNTTNCLYIIEGNEFASEDDMNEAINLLLELTLKYCGGTADIIYK